MLQSGKEEKKQMIVCHVFWWLCRLLAFCMEFDPLVLLKTAVGMHTHVLVKFMSQMQENLEVGEQINRVIMA